MNQRLERWLLADDPQYGKFSMGLVNIELKRGTPSQSHPERSEAKSKEPDEVASQVSQRDSSTKPVLSQAERLGMTDLEESIFAFSKAPDEQIGRVRQGGSTGAKVLSEPPSGGQNRNKGRVLISIGGHEASFNAALSSLWICP